MDSLPPELLELIVLWHVRSCQFDKNSALPLRLVCHKLNLAVRPFVFKTLQLEFSKFLRHASTPALPDLDRVGHLCQGIYLNMMVIRDEGMLLSFKIDYSSVNRLYLAIAIDS